MRLTDDGLADFVDGLRWSLALLGVPNVKQLSDDKIIGTLPAVDRVALCAENLRTALADQ